MDKQKPTSNPKMGRVDIERHARDAETVKRVTLADQAVIDKASSRDRRRDAVLPSPTRRGISRDEASAYIGVSSTKFDQMIRDGRMPHARRIDGRKVWDVRALDRAFECLPSSGEVADNPWDR